MDDKKEWIVSHERELAVVVASRVIEKPRLTIWMILVPVIFVYFFYRLQKYASGRKEFTEHFMVSRKRALDEAFLALDSKKPPDSLKLCRQSSVPEAIYTEYREWLDVLIDHYMDLLKAPGNHLFDLIKSVYRKHAHYLLFINRLNTVERQFNNALKPHLPDTIEEGHRIIRAIETHTSEWRRKQADAIFALDG